MSEMEAETPGGMGKFADARWNAGTGFRVRCWGGKKREDDTAQTGVMIVVRGTRASDTNYRDMESGSAIGVSHLPRTDRVRLDCRPAVRHSSAILRGSWALGDEPLAICHNSRSEQNRISRCAANSPCGAGYRVVSSRRCFTGRAGGGVAEHNM